MDRKASKPVADRIEKPDVQHRGYSDDNCQDCVKRQFDKGIDNSVRWNGKSGDDTVIGARNYGRECRSNYQGGKRGNLIGAQYNYLGSKKHPGQRGVKDASNATSATGCN